MIYDLKFVNLGITIEHMLNHIDIFGFRIAFYGIIIGIGMLLGIRLAATDARERMRFMILLGGALSAASSARDSITSFFSGMHTGVNRCRF